MLLKVLKINYSKSTTCMATRISKNSEITPKKINRIKYAESLLKGLSGSEMSSCKGSGWCCTHRIG